MKKLVKDVVGIELLLCEIEAGDIASVLDTPPGVARAIAKAVGATSDSHNGSGDDGCIYGGSGDKPRPLIVEYNPLLERAQLMRVEGLVREYDPDQPNNPFGSCLRKKFGDLPFLVFDEDTGELLRDESVMTAQELEKGYPPRKTIIVRKETCEHTYRLYEIGKRPDGYADENPVRPGKMLRPDGVSDDNIPWKKLPFEVRQLLWVAAKHTGEITLDTCREDEMDIFDKVTYHDEGDINNVSKRYQEAAVKLRELKQSDQPPSLRVKLCRRI